MFINIVQVILVNINSKIKLKPKFVPYLFMFIINVHGILWNILRIKNKSTVGRLLRQIDIRPETNNTEIQVFEDNCYFAINANLG